mmetsp:Transcript_5152/g.11930  ORF Transcript_5152/g.11930 Transcript_5152/m.11930 type:complete len:157 (+) Transcript_5152:245-715(+)
MDGAAAARLSDGTIDGEDRNIDRARDGLRSVDSAGGDTGDILRLVRTNQKLMLSVTNRNGAAVADKHRAVCDLFMKEIEKLVKRSDTTGSNTIDDKELEHLCLRLKTQLLAQGVTEWDGSAFREMVREDNGVDNILSYCRERFEARKEELIEKGVI